MYGEAKMSAAKELEPSMLAEEIRRHIPHVRLIYLFGSHARGTSRPDSDVDLAMLAAGPLPPDLLWNIAQKLAIRLGRDIDLLDLGNASTVMRMQIITTGQPIYCSSEIFRAEFENRIFSAYAWLNEERAEILNDIARRKSVYG